MTEYSISSCTAPPDTDKMNGLLREYYALMIARVQEMGGDVPTGHEPALKEFWDQIDEFLPPEGRLFIASDDDGRFIGCGSLKQVGGGKGELKRLFVRPEARGTGLGRRLVDLRIEAAHEMGLSTLLVDTLTANVEMRGLYAKLGFSEIDLFPESATFQRFPALRQYMRFYELKLGQGSSSRH
ncbi:MAG: GNAT family N-acetyltransferase [Rhodobacteraceae bacterium]|nr:MAG: GNAT family N-acetyltransferase [Paracoccaceae bacterium]